VAIAVVAVIFSLIGAFYYLRVVKVMYFDDPAEDAGAVSPVPCGVRGVMSLNGLLIILLGILPGGLMAACIQVIQVSLLH
jgi:NADH-quinone oxidoreductase subunit N